VWIVDPATESVVAYRTLLSPRRLRGDDRLDASEVLPGFSVTVAELFAI
jgi:Uma2 family endonuclease